MLFNRSDFCWKLFRLRHLCGSGRRGTELRRAESFIPQERRQQAVSLALLCRTSNWQNYFKMHLCNSRLTQAGGGRSSSRGGRCPRVRTAPRGVTAASWGLMSSCLKPVTLKSWRPSAGPRHQSSLRVILRRARLGGSLCLTGKYFQ